MTSRDWRDRERELLRNLTRVLAEECRGGILGEALEHLLEGTRAHAGAAFGYSSGQFELSAERGLSVSLSGDSPSEPPSRSSTGWKRAMAAAARHYCKGRKLFYALPVDMCEISPSDRSELQTLGYQGIAVAPIRHQRDLLGALVLLSRSPSGIDSTASWFAEMLLHIVALAAERDRLLERDATHRSRLLEAGRLASLGAVAVHLVQPLRAETEDLVLKLDLQQRQCAKAEGKDAGEIVCGQAEALASRKREAVKIATAIAHLSALCRPTALAERVNLSILCKQAVSMVRPGIERRKIAVREDYAENCWVRARRDVLLQLLVNLLLNAADACEFAAHDSPKIIVRTRNVEARALLSIDDTGPALFQSAEDAAPECAEPSKEHERAMGLRFELAGELVGLLHGQMEQQRVPAGGKSCRIFLARLVPNAAQGSVPPAEPTPRSNQTTVARQVFLVDDDELFSRMMRRALHPHHVRTATTASEAQMALLDPGYEPDLVLCDLGLPGLPGHALHARLMGSRPEIAKRFVFVTGGGAETDQAYLDVSGCPVLIKPVKLERLRELLQPDLPTTNESLDVGGDTLPSEADEGMPPLVLTRKRSSEIPTIPPSMPR